MSSFERGSVEMFEEGLACVCVSRMWREMMRVWMCVCEEEEGDRERGKRKGEKEMQCWSVLERRKIVCFC